MPPDPRNILQAPLLLYLDATGPEPFQVHEEEPIRHPVLQRVEDNDGPRQKPLLKAEPS